MPLEGNVDLTIRYAQPGDATMLAQLMCELGYQTTESEMQMRVARIAIDERYRTFVAVRDSKVCGMISTLAYYSVVHNDPCGRIVALVVRNDSRRLGAGRQLVTAVEKDFVRRGIKRVALDTRLTREDAHKFYGVTRLPAKRVAICETTSSKHLMELDVARLECPAITAVARNWNFETQGRLKYPF